jgi:hypothetical protein
MLFFTIIRLKKCNYLAVIHRQSAKNKENTFF